MRAPYTANPRAWDMASRISMSPTEVACAVERPAPRRTKTLLWMAVGGGLVLFLVVFAMAVKP